MYSAAGEFLLQVFLMILGKSVRQWEKTVKFSPAVDILWGKAYNEERY